MANAAIKANNPILDIPPDLIRQTALGVDPFEVICGRFGLTQPQAVSLAENALFKREVSIAEKELNEGGLTFKARSAAASMAALAVLHTRLGNENLPTDEVREIYKATAKLAGLEPVANQAGSGGGGTGFSVVIHLDNNSPSPAQVKTITVEQVKEVDDRLFDSLPAYLRPTDFEINTELEYA